MRLIALARCLGVLGMRAVRSRLYGGGMLELPTERRLEALRAGQGPAPPTATHGLLCSFARPLAGRHRAAGRLVTVP